MAMVLSLLPVMNFAVPVKATTSYQYNIVDRADYLYDITWICQKTVSGWCGNYAFNAGTAYHLPYGQPINAGAYIGYGVSVDGFISAAKDASSVFYSSRSTYGSTNSVYYATDCSAFVSWCWGIDRKTTYSIPLTDGVSYIGMATAANTAMLQLGDCLNSNDVGHVVLVTDLSYDSSGNLTRIEITEQTPPQLKRSYYTPSQLGSDYGGSQCHHHRILPGLWKLLHQPVSCPGVHRRLLRLDPPLRDCGTERDYEFLRYRGAEYPAAGPAESR